MNHPDRFLIDRFLLENKTVFLRVDYNVPIQKGKVTDNSRIVASLSTIKFLLSQNCKIVIGTHLGRPDGKFVSELKTDPLAAELRKLLPKERIFKLNDCLGNGIKTKIQAGVRRQIFMLENLRFYQEEEKNNPVFAHSLANLADIYINEAFSNSHRKHASMEAITHFLPALAGLELEKEIYYLSQAKNGKKAVWIMGGAKLDKIDLLKQALKKADHLLIGGALAFPFLRAKGVQVGMSKIDTESVRLAKKILQSRSARKKIVLPIDFAVTDKPQPRAKMVYVNYNQIASSQTGLDIGPKTVALFEKYLNTAQTIVWNGPLGYFEWANCSLGTKQIGRYLGRLNCLKIAGGGETSQAIKKFYLEHNFTHVSSGGGASLDFLSGKELPALAALRRNYRQFRKRY